MVHFDISSLYFSPLFTFAPVQARLSNQKKKKKRSLDKFQQVQRASSDSPLLRNFTLSNSSRSIRVRYIALNGDGKYD